jgi:hypothetical protein
MRHTYASFALDAGVTIFELARLMGTSVNVIDDTYGPPWHPSRPKRRSRHFLADRIGYDRYDRLPPGLVRV